MRKNVAKEKLLNGEFAYGVFCDLYLPATVEIVGLLGFDFVVIDAEHGPLGIETCLHMVRAADSVGITPIIRVNMNIRQHILRYLDIGALGVQLPMINTRPDAEAVVQAVKYPPVGLRGLAGVRAADYGLKMPFPEYVKEANRQTIIITHIENREAMKNVDELVKVDGVDVFFVGPTDLSTSLGYPGQFEHPEVEAAIAELGQKITKAGKVAGTMANDPKRVKKVKEWGYKYITCNSSRLMIATAKDYLAQVRAQ